MATSNDFHFEIDTTAFQEAEGKAPHHNQKLTWIVNPPLHIKHKQPFMFFDMSWRKASKDLEEIARTHVGPGVYRLVEWK